MGLYSGGLIIGRIFPSEIWGGGGLIFGRAYYYYFIYFLFFLAGGGGAYYRGFTVYYLGNILKLVNVQSRIS